MPLPANVRALMSRYFVLKRMGMNFWTGQQALGYTVQLGRENLVVQPQNLVAMRKKTLLLMIEIYF
uniref:Uncharacterized protein n=1 Tax=Romanomermis culicivorax TaxID=13658 RepID=A0A915HYQ8_ROMCU